MKINNLLGIAGSINCGKDLVGDMLMYIGDGLTREPSYDGFVENEIMKKNKYRVERVTTYEIRKYADKLKEIVALLIGCKRSDLEDNEFKNKELGEEWWRYECTFSEETVLVPKSTYEKFTFVNKMDCRLVKLTPRMILQLLGTEGGRMVIHPDVWVNALFAEYGTIYGACDPYEVDAKVQMFLSLPKWIITDVRFPENEGKAVSSRGGLLIGIKRKFALKQPKYAYLIDGGRNEYKIPYELEELDNKLYKSLTHESEIVMGDHS